MLRPLFAAAATVLLGTTLVACNESVTTSSTPIPTPTPETRSIVDLAVATPELSTLVTALTEANLVSALQGPGPFTVFAPTNAAFDALPEGTLQALLADPAGDLTNILLFHVVAGSFTAADLSVLPSAPTLFEGNSVTIVPTGDTLRLNGQANVTVANIEASNGVIHIIDGVLLPAP